MCCMLVLVLKCRNNLYNVMINMPETVGRNMCIKIEKGSGKLQPAVLLGKKKKSQTPKGLVRVQS